MFENERRTLYSFDHPVWSREQVYGVRNCCFFGSSDFIPLRNKLSVPNHWSYHLNDKYSHKLSKSLKVAWSDDIVTGVKKNGKYRA